MDLQRLTEHQQKELESFYVDPNEKYVSSLGNGYIVNYLSTGNLRRGFSLISDKRVYFKGSCFSVQGKHVVKSNEERAVDLKDVTGSGFIYKNSTGLLIGAIITSVLAASILLYWLISLMSQGVTFLMSLMWLMLPEGMLPLLVLILGILMALWIGYFKSRKTLFEIDYAGGKIAFDVSLYSKEEMDDFQKQLRRAKDLSLEKGSNVISNNFPNSNMVGLAGELEKYSDLLQRGIISQQEFDELKRKAINN